MIRIGSIPTTPAFFPLDKAEFVTAHLTRADGRSFTVTRRPDLPGLLVNNDKLEVERFTEMTMEERNGRASFSFKLVKTPENYPFTHEWITEIVSVEILEN